MSLDGRSTTREIHVADEFFRHGQKISLVSGDTKTILYSNMGVFS
jgi:hypothetical protein